MSPLLPEFSEQMYKRDIFQLKVLSKMIRLQLLSTCALSTALSTVTVIFKRHCPSPASVFVKWPSFWVIIDFEMSVSSSS